MICNRCNQDGGTTMFVTPRGLACTRCVKAERVAEDASALLSEVALTLRGPIKDPSPCPFMVDPAELPAIGKTVCEKFLVQLEIPVSAHMQMAGFDRPELRSLLIAIIKGALKNHLNGLDPLKLAPNHVVVTVTPEP